VTGRRSNWNIEEISFATDVEHLRDRLSPAEKHVVNRLVAFFATGDTIVGNNLVLNLYKHVNSPEARMFYGRQLFEEMMHVEFYLTLLDNYIPDIKERHAMFDAINNIPSIKQKADFCYRWIDQVANIDRLESDAEKRQFLLNLVTFAAAIEGLFFFAAFVYVYYLRSRGLLHGLADGTNWVFNDESRHMRFAFSVVDTVRAETPHLWDVDMQESIKAMLAEAIECEMQFAEDVLELGVVGLTSADMHEYLKFIADGHLRRLGIEPVYHARNPFPFMDLQGMQTLSMFFERTVPEYTVGVGGEVSFDEEF
jgi:ribonucleoside-diphosphate reductase beta chain